MVCNLPYTPAHHHAHLRNLCISETPFRTLELNFPESQHSLMPVVVERVKDFNQILLKDDPHHLLSTSFETICKIYHTKLNMQSKVQSF